MAFGGYLKQSTAVDILLGPFLDTTDGDTAETGLTLDVELSKNGQALTNKNDSTAPTDDSAGDIDGFYNCELDSTDTGTLGILTVVVHNASALATRLDYQVVTANWYDTMCSTDQLDVNVTNVAGTSQTANDNGADINAILTDTATTIPGLISDLDNVVDTVKAETALIVEDTATTIPGLIADLDDVIDTVKADTIDILADTATTIPGLIADLDNVVDTVKADTIDILADTDTTLPNLIATLPTADEVAEVVLTYDWTSVSGEAARSTLNALRFLRNKWSISGTTLTITKEDDSTSAWTAVVEGDSAADPIISSDPA